MRLGCGVLAAPPTHEMTRLTKFSRQALKSPPTLDSVIRLVGSAQFNEVMTAARYLKEYAIGIEIAEHLINFMEGSPALDTQNSEHRAALVKLWRSKLRFLDCADRWDDFVNAVADLGRRAELIVLTPPQSIHESTYQHCRRILSQQPLDRQHRAAYEELISRTEACQSRTYHRDGTWTANVPATPKHMVDDLFLNERLRVIQRKIAKREEGERTIHLHHKQTWQLTDEEYETRRQWLRAWRVYCRRCQEAIRRASAISSG